MQTTSHPDGSARPAHADAATQLHPAWSGPRRALVAMLAIALLGGCAVLREFAPSVQVESLTPAEYIALRRGDILTTGNLSAATRETLRVTGLHAGPCQATGATCRQALAEGDTGIDDERRLSALTELWLQEALAQDALRERERDPQVQLDAWLEVGRHAYAYLFHSGRAPETRAFEDRQTQVRDYYNLAAQEAVALLFDWYVHGGGAEDEAAVQIERLQRAGWDITVDVEDFAEQWGDSAPLELVPAASLSFAGLRSVYRRDGFGAELVAVMADDPVTTAAATRAADETREAPPEGARASDPGPPDAGARHAAGDDRERSERARRRARQAPRWSEMPSPANTVLLDFAGDDLAAVLAQREVTISVYDPYRTEAVSLGGVQVPLAANFTAGYGLWLARSGFNRQSLRSLFGRGQGIDHPHLYLMQPYDPDRRILLMIHGLASSPEAWVNVANELMGDEALRDRFQIWQFYYPTNMPIALNHRAIRSTLENALRHFDPTGTAQASHDMVVIGHSMGGVIARLMVSSSGDALWREFEREVELDDGRRERVKRRLAPILTFEPVPQIDRAIFVASPHRGTEIAGSRLGRWFGRLVRMPLTVLEGLGDVLQEVAGENPGERLPNSIDNLDRHDPFVRAAADLPISPAVRYHSIIARTRGDGPLEDSNDGLVPYWSAHLDGAVSERIIVSGHSVQETAPAIIEMRRILHEDILDEGAQDERARPTPVGGGRAASTPAAAPAIVP